MSERRLLILATVTGIKDTHCTYPCCTRCYSKLFHDYELQRWRCVKCYHGYAEEEMSWRFRLSVLITDGVNSCNVCLFGSTLDQFFGDKAKVFSRNIEIHERRHRNSENLLKLAMHEVFVGRNLYFGFRIPSYAVPNKTAMLKDVIQYYEANSVKYTQPTQSEDGIYNSNIIAYQLIPSTDAKIITVTEVIRNLIKGQAQCVKPQNFRESTVLPSFRCHELSYEASITNSQSFGQPTICLSCDSTSTTCSDCSCHYVLSQKPANVSEEHYSQLDASSAQVEHEEINDKNERCFEQPNLESNGSPDQRKIDTSNKLCKDLQYKGCVTESINNDSKMNISKDIAFPDSESIHCTKWQDIPDSEDIEAYLNDTGFESEVRSSQESLQNIQEEMLIKMKAYEQSRHGCMRKEGNFIEQTHEALIDDAKLLDDKTEFPHCANSTLMTKQKFDIDRKTETPHCANSTLMTKQKFHIDGKTETPHCANSTLMTKKKFHIDGKTETPHCANSTLMTKQKFHIDGKTETPHCANSIAATCPTATVCKTDETSDRSYSCLTETFDLNELDEGDDVEGSDDKENIPVKNQSAASVGSEISVFENSKMKEVSGVNESVIMFDGSADLFETSNFLSQVVTPNISTCRPERNFKCKSVKRTKSVQFAKRLSHVKTTHLIDLQMKMNAMKAKSTITPLAIRSCLNDVPVIHFQESEELFSQQNSTHNDSVQLNSFYSQEIFTPSPICMNKSAEYEVSHNSLLDNDDISDNRMSTPVDSCNYDSQSILFSDVSNMSKSFAASKSQNNDTESLSPHLEFSHHVFSSKFHDASVKMTDIENSAFSASQDLFSPECSQNVLSSSETSLPVKKLFSD